MRAELVVDALRWPSRAAGPTPGLIHHSDQGIARWIQVVSQHLEREELDGQASGVDLIER